LPAILGHKVDDIFKRIESLKFSSILCGIFKEKFQITSYDSIIRLLRFYEIIHVEPIKLSYELYIITLATGNHRLSEIITYYNLYFEKNKDKYFPKR